MKSMIKLTTALALVAGVASAGTSNMTATTALSSYFSGGPVISAVSATATSTTAPVSVALPTSKTVVEQTCVVRDSSGFNVPRKVTVSGSDIVVASATSMSSGTLAVGDVLNCTVYHQR